MDIKEKIKGLPEVPGVYLMKDSGEHIIYVGKSKNLKSRVGQYFINSKNHAPKILKMVQGIRDFEYIIKDTEFEALLLECRLIKDIKPMYNSQMKNHRGYVYIRLTVEEEFPRILVSGERAEDGSLYFGPYTSQSSIERAVEVIRENLKIRSCSGVKLLSSANGCLNYDLGFCCGPCTDAEAKSTYMDRINEVVSFLQGQDENLMNKLEKKMEEASKRLEFDKAARYRDDLYVLMHIINTQRAISFAGRVRNIAVLEPVGNLEIKLFLIRDNDLLYSEKFDCSKMKRSSIKENIKNSILEYMKVENKQRIKVDKEEMDQARIIFSYLKNLKNNCKYIIIPNSWLKDKSGNKLDNGIDKLLG